MGSYKYKVISRSPISDLDRKTLINLYQPIVGSEACAIYLTLVEESEIMSKLNNLTFENSRLTVILGALDQEIENGFKRLEEIGLLKRTYTKLKNLYVLQIIKPLAANQFFGDVFYDKMLKNHLDEENYEILKFHCQGAHKTTISNDDFDREKSAAIFGEFFSPSTGEIQKMIGDNSQKMVNNLSLVAKQNLDLGTLQVALAQKGIVPSCLTSEIIDFLIDNQPSCSLDDQEIVNLLVQTYDQNLKKINFNVFKVLFQRELLVIKSATITPSQQKAKEMNLFESYDYATALLSKEPGFNIKKIIDILSGEYHLSNGVVNCLLDFSYYKNNGKIVGEYLFKIAKTLNKKHISNTLETMSYLKQAVKYSCQSSLASFHSTLTPSSLNKSSKILKMPDLSWMNSQKNNRDEHTKLDDLDLQLATLDLIF